MYYLFKHHHVLPSAFQTIPRGERIVLRAMALQEIEDMREAIASARR